MSTEHARNLAIPRHLFVPDLPEQERELLRTLGTLTMRSGVSGYAASWHISEQLAWAADLDSVASHHTPGNAAMRTLRKYDMVEEVPNLGCRYRLTALGCAVVLLWQLDDQAQAFADQE